MDLKSDDVYKKEIKEIIATVAKIKANSITDTASLREDLKIDSLQAIQIVALLEEKYDIKIDEMEIFNISNLPEIIDLLKEYLKDK